MRSHAHHPRLSAAALALAVLALAGCGGDNAPSPILTTTEVPSASATEAPTSTAAPTPAPAPDPGSDSAYLPVPDGVELTEPGARLRLDDPAVAAWLPRQDLVGVVEVAVTRIEKTTVQASLAGFDLDSEAQRSTPHFVTTKVTNVGDTDLGARVLPMYFLDNRGVLLAPTGVARDFEPCPGSTLPGVFAPGDSTSSCLIFLVPQGSVLQTVMFRPPEGVAPLEWTGEVRPLGDRSGEGKRSGKRQRDGAGKQGRS